MGAGGSNSAAHISEETQMIYGLIRTEPLHSVLFIETQLLNIDMFSSTPSPLSYYTVCQGISTEVLIKQMSSLVSFLPV